MARTLLERLNQLASAGPEDPMMQTAKQTGLLTMEGMFPFQRWNPQQQKLQVTNQTAIPVPPHDQVLGTAPGVGTGPMLHSEVPVIETSGHGTSDSLADPGLHETGRPAMCPTSSPGQHGMESVGAPVETTHASFEQASGGSENPPGERNSQGLQQGQSSGQGQSGDNNEELSRPLVEQLKACYEGLRLANIDNWCFINSAFLATTWALLNSHSFTANSWGPHVSQLATFLMQSPNNDPVHLIDIPCFQPILASWSSNIGQGDPVEFIAHLLRGLEFQNFDMRWDTRVQIGSLTHIHDQNKDACNPLVLQFDTIG